MEAASLRRPVQAMFAACAAQEIHAEQDVDR